ncbi:MAG: UvrD-helicase domain-containing protein, partial [Pseudomonadota bacterium]
MMVFDEATRRQIRAAAPDRSTWLAANAGSGKTRVLTDRVARLLFANVAPQNILCLTYTKSAASEMQNRLFQRLGEWTLMQDDALAQALTSLGVETRRDASALAKARRLFAAAVETPGGLKIQTIHSFCAGVLRRFPLEAGIEPNFQEIDDRRARQLRLHILEQMVEGPEIEQVDALARYVSDATLDQLLVDISNNAALFRHDIAEDSTYTSPGAEVSYVIAPGDAEVVAAMLPGLQDSGVQDQKLAAALTQVSWIHPTERDQA